MWFPTRTGVYIQYPVFPQRRCEKLYCWVQSMDLRDPLIALCNLWIPSLRRNPWIAQGMLARPMDFAYDANFKSSLAQTYKL